MATRGRALLGLASVLASVGSASCVPASEPAEPAGAIGFTTEPTGASLGQPFETDDGWAVRIETLALQLNVTASTSPGDGFSGGYSGDYAEYRLASNQRADLFARALHAGPATVTVSLGGSYVSDDYSGDDDAENIGLPPDVVARFLRAPDAAPATPYRTGSGPSVLLVARAEKAGRTVMVDFTMTASSYIEGGQPTVTGDVRANALTATALLVVGEALFQDTSTGQLVFDDFAAADANGDGIVTGAELGATSTLTLGGLESPRVNGLLDNLYKRAGRVLVLR